MGGTTPELRRTSSFDRTWEETVAESVANELVLQSMSSGKSRPLASAEQYDEASRKKDSRPKSGRLSHEEKKIAKPNEEKGSRPQKLREFHDIKISQVCLHVVSFAKMMEPLIYKIHVHILHSPLM